MHAARVVADHAAQRVAIVRGRIGAEREVSRLGLVPQIVQDGPRLDPRPTLVPVDLEHVVHVFAHVHDHGRIARGAGEIRGAAARHDRSAERAADRHGLDDVVGVTRQHDADRNLPVVGCVGRVQRAVAVAEAHFPAHSFPQRRGEARDVDADCGAADRVGSWRRLRRRVRTRGGGSADRQLRNPGHVDSYLRASERLNSRPSPGRVEIGMKRAVARGEHAVKQQMLDAHVIVEILHMTQALHRARGVCVQRGRAVRRQRSRRGVAQSVHDE